MEMAQRTAGDPQTPEYQTVRELCNKLRIGIQNDLVEIVTKVFSAGIISDNEWRTITDSETHEADNVRADRFIKVLLDKITINPKCLGTFKQILAEEHSHRSLLDMIGEPIFYYRNLCSCKNVNVHH